MLKNVFGLLFLPLVLIIVLVVTWFQYSRHSRHSRHHICGHDLYGLMTIWLSNNTKEVAIIFVLLGDKIDLNSKVSLTSRNILESTWMFGCIIEAVSLQNAILSKTFDITCILVKRSYKIKSKLQEGYNNNSSCFYYLKGGHRGFQAQ